MSYAPSTLSECPNIQVELNNYFQTCNSAELREPTPLLDWLMSPANRTGYSQVVAPGGGKIKTVELRYDQRILEAAVTQPGNLERTCTATTKRGDLTTTCEIDPADYWEVSEKISVTDFIYACRNNFDIVNKKLKMLADALIRKVATAVAEDVVALKGNWGAMVDPSLISSDFLQVQTLKSIASGDISPNAFENIDMALKQSNFCNGAAIFSGATLYQYYRLMLAGCCSQDGLALDQILSLYGTAVLYDLRVQKAFSDADKAIALAPGAVQLVTFNLNDNGVSAAAGTQTVGSNYLNALIFDPASGIPIDLTIKDECPGDLHIFMRTTIKPCALPTDLYAPGDDLEGVVGVNGIEVANS